MFRATDAFGSYSVDDIQRAKEFYGGTLGLEVSERMGGLEVHLGAHRVFLYHKDDHQPASFTVLNFPVDDIARTYDDLTARGVRFGYRNDPALDTDEKGIHWGARRGGPNIAWFTDPAGNVLSVLEEVRQ